MARSFLVTSLKTNADHTVLKGIVFDYTESETGVKVSTSYNIGNDQINPIGKNQEDLVQILEENLPQILKEDLEKRLSAQEQVVLFEAPTGADVVS